MDLIVSEKPNSSPGLYILLLELLSPRRLTIGALGTFSFAPGIYAYTGSARGPGGLPARIRRHLRSPSSKKKHWHIDYLAHAASCRAVLWAAGTLQTECEWAKRTGSYGSRFPQGFGASDCRCAGHLIALESGELSSLYEHLAARCDVPLYCCEHPLPVVSRFK